MHVRGMISDWHLIPVRDCLACSPLAWFFFSPVLLAVHLFISFSLRFPWRFDLCALMPCFSFVYYCAFWAVSIALRRDYVFWPLSTEFCLWLLGCIFCCTGFLCACLHELLGWLGFYWSFTGFLSARSRYCNESAL